MSAIGDIFCDETTQRVLDDYRELTALWKEALDRARPNQVVALPSQGFSEGLNGVAIKLKYPVDRVHSGWLFRHVSDASSHHNVSNIVGVAAGAGDFKKLTQSSTIGATSRLYMVATGPYAEPILHAAISSETSFNPEMFDSDGYLR